ncbi:MAG: hypothetical protein JRM80_11400 [Nitrososphaerota archaeon]|nr:hypothetical protein [Nitrososphaerota archaeon]MDG6990129.1 hypothetical protein [Nitrososphaerota archaeon]
MAGFGWGMALGFALAVVTLFSLLRVAAYPREAFALTVNQSRSRAFKGEKASMELLLASGRASPVAELEVVSFPDGLEVAMEGEGPRRVLTATSRYAGVFTGLKVRVGFTEPLALFSRTEVRELELSFEFLPASLLERREPLMVSAAILGDYPAGRRGFGQEFYSVEVYAPSSSSKDILWKRFAKLPGDVLMSRVGEANIPERLTVCFMEPRDKDERRTPRWMDLASEAIARVGLSVISTGTKLRLIHTVDGSSTSAEAKDVGELASALVGLWGDHGPKDRTKDGPASADLIIAPESEASTPEVMGAVMEKPAVLLAWGSQRKGARVAGVVFFTGQEDVSGLVAGVLSR